ncbi:RHS repeat-associated core domain-containing protein [Streptomyces sp. NPDC041003]|uniref:RHS repeat-associated core domain-containing protein n=1 Tax=Streptomyces sp. NPDC041003 TaxID=3155730 RepID=UPI003409BC72
MYAYDELDRPSKVTNPDGGVTLTGYNPAGQVETSTDANNRVTTYGYDAQGRVTSIKNPLGKTVSYGYGLEGNRTTLTNARGQKVTTSVDARSLPTQVTYSDGTPNVTYGYDDASRVNAVTDATGSRTVTYNDDDRVSAITAPGITGSFTYDWNTDGTLKSRTYPDGRSTAYAYDKNGRIKSQTTNSKTTGYTYDAAGNTTSITLPTATARAETRTYDPAGRLATLTTPATGTRTFGYDENNRLASEKAATGYPTRYAYDDTGRVARMCGDTSATASCLATPTAGAFYAYDPVGNLKTAQASGTTTTYNYDDADRLSSSTAGTTTKSYTYDDDGNQLTDGNETYTYDPVGRVKTAAIGANTFAFTHDADGNRTTTKKNGALTGTSRWDVNNPLAQLATDTDATGALLADYQYDPDGTARSMDRTAGTYYFAQDRQNSVATVYDATGTDNYRYSYSLWGYPTATATISGGQTSPFGYTGQYKDQTLPDRLQLRARSYDPVQRRFTTTDPVPATPGSPNHSAYNYVGNDPLNLSDPSGACPMCIGAGIGAAFGGGIYALTHQDDFSWRDFAIATGKGAVIGAGAGFLAPAGASLATTLGLTGGRALAVAALTNAAVGAAYTWAINTAQCQPTTPADLLLGAAGGAVSSLLGPAWRSVKGFFGSTGSNSGQTIERLVLPTKRGWPGAKKPPPVVEIHPAPPNWNGQSRLAEADEMVKEFALRSYSKKANTRTFAGAYNARTGEISLASSGGRYPGASYCAEGNACWALGGDASDIMFTNAWTVKKVNGSLVASPKPVCIECQVDYDPGSFISGIQPADGGRWIRKGLVP